MSTIKSESNNNLDSDSEMSVTVTVPKIATMRKLSEIDYYDMKKFKPLNDQILFTGKSLQLSKFTFEDSLGNEKSAEVIKKTHHYGNENSIQESESVLSIAILRRHILCDCLLLVKQYRPTLKSYVLEFPAKIIENPETVEIGAEAVKFLENSTGYKSMVVKHISPETALDPELCDGKLKLVSLFIDGDDPIKNGTMNGEEHEKETEIVVLQVPINGLLDRLNEYSKNGIIIDSRVYAFAIGLKKGEKLAERQFRPENIEEPI